MEINLIANTMVEPGMSGGNKIFIEIAKTWMNPQNKINIYTSDVGRDICEKNGLESAVFFTWTASRYSRLGIIGLYIMGIIRGILFTLKKKKATTTTVVWSTSDFWPDSIQGFLMSRGNAIWVASFPLVLPSPFSKEFRYRGLSVIKGVLAYITQFFSYRAIKWWADVVIIYGPYDVERFVTRTRSGDDIIVIGGGVDISLLRMIPTKTKEYLGVFLGRIHPQKGIIELIDIWKEVCELDRNARLAIIGTGDMEEEVRKKIAEYHLEGNVDMLGFIDGEDKVQIYKDSKVFLYPATLDHWSIAPVEAMMCGLPVITFDLPCLKSYPGIKGMKKVEAFNLSEFSRSIVTLSEDESEYRRLQSDAIEWANGWDWNIRAEKVMDRIKEAVK